MSVILTVDIETRSTVDLPTCGAARYGADPDTEIMCIAYTLGVAPPKVIPLVLPPGGIPELLEQTNPVTHEFYLTAEQIGTMEEFIELLEREDTIFSAHNEAFELSVFFGRVWDARKWHMKPKRDTAPMLRVRGYPGGLEKGLLAMSAPFRKDMSGNKIMKKLCKPRPAWNKTHLGAQYFSAPADLAANYAYCIDDVIGQAWVADVLPPLPAFEQAVYDCTQRRNAYGLRFDMAFVDAAIEVAKTHSRILWQELSERTGGALTTTNQVARVKDYLNDTFLMGLKDLQTATIKDLLDTDTLPELARFILNVRVETSAASVSKLHAIKRMAIGDRIYGTTIYCGAIATRRITSTGVNLANFPRGDKSTDIDAAITDVKALGYEGAKKHGSDAMKVVKDCLRGSIIPADGMEFIGADYSSVEAVIGMWLAGAPIYKQMREEPGVLYLKTGSTFAGRQITEADEAERKHGKIGSLGFQYGAGVAGFRKLAKTLGWDIAHMTDKEVEALRDGYRRTYPQLCSKPTANKPYREKGLWHLLETQCIAAVMNPNRKTRINDKLWCVFDSNTQSLDLWLPSGRPIHMPAPAVGKGKFGGRSLSFLGFKQGKLTRVDTYGGSLHESCCQSLSRDITVAAELRLEAAGYRPVQQVYDEIWTEVPIGQGSVKHLESIMCADPGWFKDLKIHAEGWRTNRMRKM